MKKIISIANFILWDILFLFREKIVNIVYNSNITNLEKKIIFDLKNKGYFFLENFLNKEECFNVIKNIDCFIKDKPEQIENLNGDKRINGINKICTISENFLNNNFLINIIKKFEGENKIIEKFTLGAVLQYGSSGGDWHRDRTYRRFKYTKCIIYLNEVDDKNGPFEYIEGSNTMLKSILYYKKNIVNLSEKNLNSTIVNKIISMKSSNLVRFKGRPGDLIIFDGRGIHRGAPLVSGKRYALTNYYRFDKKENINFKFIG